MSPDAALSACHFLRNASTMLLWGASAFIWLLMPIELARNIDYRLRAARMAALGLAVATTLAVLPLLAGTFGEGWSDVLTPATIRDVLFETNDGQAWQAQAGAAFLLLAAFLAPPPFRSKLTVIAAGLLLTTFALTGHAAMQNGWPGAAHRTNEAVHLLSSGAWLGALLPLLLTLKVFNDPAVREQAHVALRRFSNVGHIAVLLAITSGLINMMLIVGHWPVVWSSPYQALLACKITLVTMMIGIAIVNRYVFTPRLARHPSSIVRAIRLGTMTEIALGLCAVVLVSIFAGMEPV
jgi:putative copper resistance protein D